MQELDFELEAANSLRCQAHLLHPRSKVRGQVVVPRIQQGMVSKRVLAMEFVEGVKVTDRWVWGDSLLVHVAPAETGSRSKLGQRGSLQLPSWHNGQPCPLCPKGTHCGHGHWVVGGGQGHEPR